MGGAGLANVVLVLSSEDKVEGLGEEKAGHEVVDPVCGKAVLEEGEVDPDGKEGDVSGSEEGVEGRNGGLADGEEVAGAIRAGVVHLREDGHGDRGLRGTIGEEETVLVRVGDGEGAIQSDGGIRVKLGKGE